VDLGCDGPTNSACTCASGGRNSPPISSVRLRQRKRLLLPIRWTGYTLDSVGRRRSTTIVCGLLADCLRTKQDQLDPTVEALPVCGSAFWIPLFVFLFAAVYFLMDGTTSNAFSEPDDPAGCLVFTGDGVDDRRVQRHCRTRGVGPALTTVQTVGDPLPTTCLPFREPVIEATPTRSALWELPPRRAGWSRCRRDRLGAACSAPSPPRRGNRAQPTRRGCGDDPRPGFSRASPTTTTLTAADEVGRGRGQLGCRRRRAGAQSSRATLVHVDLLRANEETAPRWRRRWRRPALGARP
jgi:hypothetical protein